MKCLSLSCVCLCGISFVLYMVLKRVISTNELHENNIKITNKNVLGNSSNLVHWFVQITDVHICIFRDESRIRQFEDFCRVAILQAIKPEVVVVTGDLTDAKHADEEDSGQFFDEWAHYSNILNKTGVLKKTAWLDVRGNHDAFNVPSVTSEHNYFRQYSVRGRRSPRSYHYVHATRSGHRYSFIAIDACPDPGPKRPFNFYGLLPEAELELIAKLKSESDTSDFTLWFGHYPLAFISYGAEKLRSLIHPSSVYMCGHLHTFRDWSTNMYTKHPEGFLELELADWKDNRKFRVFAYDGGLFSFVDNTFGSWPIVLITNPKDYRFLRSPIEEELELMKSSTHIRILAFSTALIQRVEVLIDNVYLGIAVHVDGPLYAIPWRVSNFLKGVHTIHVKVMDSAGRIQNVSQKFSLDGTTANYGIVTEFILKADLVLLFKITFSLLLVVSLAPLIAFRLCLRRLPVLASGQSSCIAIYIHQWLRRFHLLVRCNTIFYWLVFMHIYVAGGPWFIGHIIDNHIGLCFVFGIFVNNTFIPGSLTILYGVIQYATFNIPLMLFLATLLDKHFLHSNQRQRLRWYSILLQWMYTNWLFVLIIVWQTYLCFSGFLKTYGIMAFLLGPVRTWFIPLSVYLRYVAMHYKYTGQVDIVDKPSSEIN